MYLLRLLQLIALLFIIFFVVNNTVASSYNRSDFNYSSYKSDTLIGFYTGQLCDVINIDHVVSLKDAYKSGASSWSGYKKETFANDKDNHVPSCARVNSSKGSTTPKNFLRRSNNNKGLDYRIIRWCGYVDKYKAIKIKYQLSFANNDMDLLAECEKVNY